MKNHAATIQELQCHLDCSLFFKLCNHLLYSFAAGYIDDRILLASLQDGTGQFNSVIRL